MSVNKVIKYVWLSDKYSIIKRAVCTASLYSKLFSAEKWSKFQTVITCIAARFNRDTCLTRAACIIAQNMRQCMKSKDYWRKTRKANPSPIGETGEMNIQGRPESVFDWDRLLNNNFKKSECKIFWILYTLYILGIKKYYFFRYIIV